MLFELIEMEVKFSKIFFFFCKKLQRKRTTEATSKIEKNIFIKYLHRKKTQNFSL